MAGVHQVVSSARRRRVACRVGLHDGHAGGDRL
jgi:hypothetical protein